MIESGKTITAPEEILEEQKIYYNKLYTSLLNNLHGEIAYKECIKAVLDSEPSLKIQERKGKNMIMEIDEDEIW